MYFCFWKVFSRPLRWTSLKTARRSIPLRGLPLMFDSREKAFGKGSILVAARRGQHKEKNSILSVIYFVISTRIGG